MCAYAHARVCGCVDVATVGFLQNIVVQVLQLVCCVLVCLFAREMLNEMTFDLDIRHGGFDHLESVWIRCLGQAHG